MDPNEALRRIREITTEYIDAEAPPPPDVVEELLMHTEALDGWMTNGGFLPAAWQEKRT